MNAITWCVSTDGRYCVADITCSGESKGLFGTTAEHVALPAHHMKVRAPWISATAGMTG